MREINSEILANEFNGIDELILSIKNREKT